MSDSGAMATCVPVSLDGDGWEAAFFLQVAGPESKEDRRIMRKSGGPFSIGLESDVVTTEHGAVVVIRPELHTRPEDPLVMEILLTPGDGGSHHEALRLLSAQPRLTWMFGDRAGWAIHAQSHPLGEAEHAGSRELLADALRHDTMVRMTGTYDAGGAVSEVVRHYGLRAAAGAAEGRAFPSFGCPGPDAALESGSGRRAAPRGSQGARFSARC
jgi:hypothetical protein